MKRLFILFLIGMALLVGQGVLAAGDAAKGEKLAMRCACHRNRDVLDGMEEQKLVDLMMDYKTGEKKFGPMNSLMEGYSKQDMEDLAAYYSQKK